MSPKLNRSNRSLLILAVLAGTLLSSGCAMFNRGQLVLVRNVTFGQELMDLKQAKEQGALTEAEYQACKAKVLEMVDDVEVKQVVNDYVPDQVSKPDDD